MASKSLLTTHTSPVPTIEQFEFDHDTAKHSKSSSSLVKRWYDGTKGGLLASASFLVTHARSPSDHDGSRRFIPKWKMFLIIVGVTLLSTCPIVILCTSALISIDAFSSSGSCLPNGEVLFLQDVSPAKIYFDPALILDISLGFGTLSFASVKIIDVIWDVVVGRGGQVLLGYVSYCILGQALLQSMEFQSVSFERFAATSDSLGSVKALLILGQDWLQQRKANQTRPK
ncbi:hypothetical protein MBLNU459_g5727t1 [Dothideomycetes sp. NU459]